MFFSTVTRKYLLPAAVIVAEASHSKDSQNQDNTCRPSELPIYTADPPTYMSQQIVPQEPTPNFIENSVRHIRQTMGKYKEEYHAYEKVAKESLSDSKQNVEWLVNYLRQEDNTLPKAGAIGIGALAGFIFGLRGGFFKRTIYATTGALGMAAVCYPKEASEYTQTGMVEGKKVLTIAYNFVYGVKKDDPPLELPSLPKLPANFSEAWDSIKSTTSSFISDEAASRVDEVKNSNVSREQPVPLVATEEFPVNPESLECPK